MIDDLEIIDDPELGFAHLLELTGDELAELRRRVPLPGVRSTMARSVRANRRGKRWVRTYPGGSDLT